MFKYHYDVDSDDESGAAAASPKPAKGFGFAVEERRLDPNDGQAYTLAEFMDEYDGTAEWESATKAPLKTSAAGGFNFAAPAPDPTAGLDLDTPASGFDFAAPAAPTAGTGFDFAATAPDPTAGLDLQAPAAAPKNASLFDIPAAT